MMMKAYKLMKISMQKKLRTYYKKNNNMVTRMSLKDNKDNKKIRMRKIPIQLMQKMKSKKLKRY